MGDAQELKGTDIIVNNLIPGVSATGIWGSDDSMPAEARDPSHAYPTGVWAWRGSPLQLEVDSSDAPSVCQDPHARRDDAPPPGPKGLLFPAGLRPPGAPAQLIGPDLSRAGEPRRNGGALTPGPTALPTTDPHRSWSWRCIVGMAR